MRASAFCRFDCDLVDKGEPAHPPGVEARALGVGGHRARLDDRLLGAHEARGRQHAREVGAGVEPYPPLVEMGPVAGVCPCTITRSAGLRDSRNSSRIQSRSSAA